MKFPQQALPIVTAAALSLTVLGAGATFARTVETRVADRAEAGTIYSDLGTAYGSYDYSGRSASDLPVWNGDHA
ncbi:hypothetical protein ACKFR8_08790 [Corynebacterium axilliensis]|uniref:hypothetical protein n=1 Tax=Corynebacterium sp. YSMAA5_1_F9 TaxID=3383591 RepID=UPI0038D07D3D